MKHRSTNDTLSENDPFNGGSSVRKSFRIFFGLTPKKMTFPLASNPRLPARPLIWWKFSGVKKGLEPQLNFSPQSSRSID